MIEEQSAIAAALSDVDALLGQSTEVKPCHPL
jgi:hypothetical protein